MHRCLGDKMSMLQFFLTSPKKRSVLDMVQHAPGRMCVEDVFSYGETRAKGPCNATCCNVVFVSKPVRFS